MIIVIAIILFTIAGYFEALMDLLQFRWDIVKKYFADEQFYNPKISWKKGRKVFV